MLPGVYEFKRSDGVINYRSSITIDKKHISLGSYPSEEEASAAYMEAGKVYGDPGMNISGYSDSLTLSFDKYVSLINLRDNHIYFATPIFVRKRDFSYYLSPSEELKFDADDLFYLSTRTISRRGNHLFVSDYGSQVSLHERFGIKSFSVPGRDFLFVNGDPLDYRRENIKLINRYNGVFMFQKKLRTLYKVIIHVRSNYVVGVYPSEKEAAIAYNKAADTLIKNGIKKKFQLNFVEGVSNKEYAEIYTKVKISDTVKKLSPTT